MVASIDRSDEALSGYRAHLDGLRAVAVSLVVLYHSGLGAFAYGFIGVDVFFVLSGYLVTQLLLRDIAGHGVIRLREFYARRYRRLLPASFVALMVTAVAYTIAATVAEVAAATNAFKAAFLYVANWYFIHQSGDYFAADINRNPVVHFWSLAVEEQFYLAWPLLLGGLFALVRRAQRPQRWLRGAIAVAGLASLVAAVQLSTSDISRAYYGTDTRAYQLLAGALLALTPRLMSRAARYVRSVHAVALLGIVAIVGLATTQDGLDPIERGIAITLATGLLLIAIEASAPAGLARRALSLPVIVYLGRVSYGTYLWHWPIIVILTTAGSPAPLPLAGVTLVLATALAATSHHLLERPVRTSPTLDRHRTGVIVAGLAISLVAGLLLAPAVLNAKPASTIAYDWEAALRDNPPLPECSPGSTAGCTVVTGSGPHLLLMGDSNARMFIPALTEIARAEDLTLSVAVAPLCPWPRGVFYLRGGDDCRTAKSFWYNELLDDLAPDMVVLGQRPMDDPAHPVSLYTPSGEVDFGDDDYAAALESATAATIAQLRNGGRQVVVLEPIPIAAKEADPLICLSSADDIDDCIYEANAEPTPIERYYRGAGEDDEGLWSVDLDALVCPQLPRCLPVVDELIVKRDNNHITGTYSAHLADAIAARLRGEGVLP